MVVCLFLLTDWVKVAHEDVDFGGSDIRYVLLDDADTCQRTCTEDALCQFYSYVTAQFTDPAYRYSISNKCKPSLFFKNVLLNCTRSPLMYHFIMWWHFYWCCWNKDTVDDFVFKAPLLPQAVHHHACSSPCGQTGQCGVRIHPEELCVSTLTCLTNAKKPLASHTRSSTCTPFLMLPNRPGGLILYYTVCIWSGGCS